MGRDLRFILDAVLFAAFLAAYTPTATGIPIHEWLALALTVPALVHLIINWDWVAHATGGFFAKLRAATRLNLVVDVALFVAAVSVTLSGFMVSQTLALLAGITPVPDATWHLVHSWSADATILLLLLHTALHWNWWVNTMKWLFEPLGAPRVAFPDSRSIATVSPSPPLTAVGLTPALTLQTAPLDDRPDIGGHHA